MKPRTSYRDLREFGLEFVTPDDDAFPALVEEIQNRPQGLGPQAARTPDAPAAVLLNRSEKAIVVLSYVWKHTTTAGQVRQGRTTNLVSSMQMDVLTGQAEVSIDRFNFILPGSKRLITEQGMFGDNSDVLPPEPVARGGGFGWGGDGPIRRGRGEEHAVAIELLLDVVFFEDGLCGAGRIRPL